MNPIVIIGSGLAGYAVAREFRKLDKETPLLLVTGDDGAFYSKPMLSNGLAQNRTAESLAVSPAARMAAELNADIRPFSRVTALDAAAREIALSGPQGDCRLAYGKLVLALGADPMRLPLEGDGAPDILSVNDRHDYAVFRAALEGRKKVAILGAGLIGCEFANDLAGAGYAPTVFDVAPQPLGRLLPPLAGQFMAQRLGAAGVGFHLGTSVHGVERRGRGYALHWDEGQGADFDLVLSAVGLRPRVALARDAGLSVGRGIAVDRLLRTSNPEVFALGDCAEVEGLLLPFVLPLMAGARALAATLAGTEKAVSYPAMPVVVKTPACPTVVSPPPLGCEGSWQEEMTESGVRALCRDTGGRPLGFALLGGAVAEKQALTRELPPWL